MGQLEYIYSAVHLNVAFKQVTEPVHDGPSYRDCVLGAGIYRLDCAHLPPVSTFFTSFCVSCGCNIKYTRAAGKTT